MPDQPPTPDKPRAHIEDLYQVIMTYVDKIQRLRRDVGIHRPAELARRIQEARAEVQEFCEKHNLPIDFEPRE